MMIKDMVLILISMLIMINMILVGVAFLTLLESKILEYIQICKGPNISLFTKEQIYPFLSNYVI